MGGNRPRARGRSARCSLGQGAGAPLGVRLDSRQPSSTEVRMRVIGLVLALSLTFVPLAGETQPAKVPRIGYLEPGAAGSGTPFFKAFRQGLADLGWVEGQNIEIELRAAEGKYER